MSFFMAQSPKTSAPYSGPDLLAQGGSRHNEIFPAEQTLQITPNAPVTADMTRAAHLVALQTPCYTRAGYSRLLKHRYPPGVSCISPSRGDPESRDRCGCVDSGPAQGSESVAPSGAVPETVPGRHRRCFPLLNRSCRHRAR